MTENFLQGILYKVKIYRENRAQVESYNWYISTLIGEIYNFTKI